MTIRRLWLLFPSPIGVLFFQIDGRKHWRTGTGTISVPYRGSIFPNTGKVIKGYEMFTISVPYRGSIFPNSSKRWFIASHKPRFPSPIGVLFFQICKLNHVTIVKYLFPSPIGVLFFQIRNGEKYEKNEFRISVPYRGSIFPNKSKVPVRYHRIISVPYRGSIFPNKYEECIEYCKDHISVPYRGSIFPNTKPITKTADWNVFPSPIGVLFFQICLR